MVFRRLQQIAGWLLLAGLVVPSLRAAEQTKPKHHHYRIYDLGTLGGPTSFLFGFTVPVNRRGWLTGCADTASLDPNYPNLNPYFGSDPFIQHAYKWKDGTRVDLGTLPGGSSSCTQWMNDNETIVGASNNGLIDSLTGTPEIRAVLWDREGNIRDLGTLGGNESVAWAVNNQGQVTGNALNEIPDDFAAAYGLPGATQTHAFLWQDGMMQDLGTLGGPDSGPYAMNQRGQIVGIATTDSIVNPTTGLPTSVPFFWDRGVMVGLGSFGGTYGIAFNLNNRGQVVGYSNLPGDNIFEHHAFVWSSKTGFIDLGTLGGHLSEAWAINDAGDIAGVSFVPGDDANHATLWSRGKTIDLGVVSGDICTLSLSINSARQVVGFSNKDECAREDHTHGFLWDNGTIFDLNRLISNRTTLRVVEGVFINERGEIAANSVTLDGASHAVALIPCDDAHPGVDGCDYSGVDETAGTTSAKLLASPTAVRSDQRNGRQQFRHFRVRLR